MPMIRWHSNYFDPREREILWTSPGRISLRKLCGTAQVTVWRNGFQVDPEGDSLEIDAGENDDVRVVARPAGIDPITALITVGISFAASFVLSKLIKPPRQSEDTGDDGPTYGFQGLSGTRTEGRPIQMPYGIHRSAGTVLNEGVQNPATSRGPSVYFAQIGFGHGPIAAIGDHESNTATDAELMTSIGTRTVPIGIQLDGDAVENAPGLAAIVRLGTTDQDAAVGFDRIEQQADVELELIAPEDDAKDPSTSIIDAITDTQGDQDTYWDSYGQSFDLPEPAEFCRLTVSFPQGYFTSTAGVAGERHFALLVRYIELDGDGRPIATGGQFGDGYVRLSQWFTTYRATSAFTVDFAFPLLDPRAFNQASTRGTSLWGDGTNSSSDCSVATPSVPWSDSTALAGFTVAAWINIHEFVVTGITNVYCIAYQKTGTTGGFAVRFGTKTFTAGPSTNIDAWIPILEMPGSNLAGDEFFEGHDDSARVPRFKYTNPAGGQHGEVHRRHHVVFTYRDRATVDGANDRLRLYVDGELIYETLDDVQLKGSTATFHAGRDPTLGRPMDGEIDELWVLQDELSAEDVRRAYNNGDGLMGTVALTGDPDEDRLRFILDSTDLAFGYHFDENTGIGTGTAQSFDTLYNNDATIGGAMALFGLELVRKYEVDNLIRKSRYRIEVARNVEDSTDDESFDGPAEWTRLTWAVEQRQRYPSIASLALRVAASEVVNSRAPEVTADLKGRLCPIWTGTDPILPSFARRWTRNPAWIVLDIVLTERIGLGEYFTRSDIDVISFQEWADYCDEIIYDLRGNRIYGDESATTTLPAVTRLKYDVSVPGESDFDNRGRIQVWLDGPPPANWGVGKYVAWTGEATASGFVDHNYAADVAGGYEVHSMTTGGGSAWVVAVYWDRFDEGDPWTDGQWLDLMAGLSHTPYVGIYEGRMLRHTYDAIHDTAEDAWEVIQQIASVGRGIVFFDGKRVRAKVNQTRSPVGIVSMASIIQDSFEMEYSGPNERPNAYTIEFLDEAQNWERRAAYVEHESVADATATARLRQETVFVRGITRREAALRHGKFLVNIDQGIRRTGTFRASIDAVHYEPGDVLVLQHDVLPWGKGGRVLEESTAADEIVLDREITIGGAGTWFVDVSHPSQNGFVTRGIVTAAGTYAAGTALTLDTDLPFTATKGLRYVFYETASRKLVEITALRLASDLEVTAEWAEYVEAVYDDTPTIEPEPSAPEDAIGSQDEVDAIGSQDELDAIGAQA